jgi:hypothetical protein
MPKRSNPFQRLVTFIHERLGQEWKVEESRMLTDLVTGELREVDIVAQFTVATYPIFLSIECRDHARPADVTWVESMAKKHDHLPTSKLVLWCRSGFTKPALKKAQFLKIDTVSQADAVRTDWARMARDLKGGHLQYVTPSFTAFIDVDSPAGEPRRLDQVANAVWYNSHGAQSGSIPALIQFILGSAEARTAILDNTSSIGAGNFYAELQPPTPWFVDLPEGTRAQIRRIGIGIETVTEKASLETASALNEGQVLTLASAALNAGTLEMLVQESPDGHVLFQSKLHPKRA